MQNRLSSRPCGVDKNCFYLRVAFLITHIAQRHSDTVHLKLECANVIECSAHHVNMITHNLLQVTHNLLHEHDNTHTWVCNFLTPEKNIIPGSVLEMLEYMLVHGFPIRFKMRSGTTEMEKWIVRTSRLTSGLQVEYEDDCERAHNLLEQLLEVYPTKVNNRVPIKWEEDRDQDNINLALEYFDVMSTLEQYLAQRNQANKRRKAWENAAKMKKKLRDGE